MYLKNNKIYININLINMEWTVIGHNGKKKNTVSYTHIYDNDIKYIGILLISKDKDGRIIIGLLNNASKQNWLINHMGITLTSILEDFAGKLDKDEEQENGIIRVAKELSIGLINIDDECLKKMVLYHKYKTALGILYMEYDDILLFQNSYKEKLSTLDKSTVPKYCSDMDNLNFIHLDRITDSLKRVEIYTGQKYSEKYSLTKDVYDNLVWLSYRTQSFLVDKILLERVQEVIELNQ